MQRIITGLLSIMMVYIFLCDADASTHSASFSPSTNYLAIMMSYCEKGNVEAGQRVERIRNLKIDTLGLDDKKIAFSDLYLLSKVITAEAGCSWLSMEWKLMVGEVLLNRVASVEFPNTIKDCVFQKGQYHNANSSYFANLMPYKDCVEAAARLLSGERVINDESVVFQANFKQGSGVYCRLYDEIMGATYFCYSSHPELYK